ncbi:MAG: hypothetical protein IPN33_23835 [Saprospiraceae bacterium]|nr:hypothetical protein [Saprospiraceae bacterium]
MKKIQFFLTGALLLFLAGCQKDLPVPADVTNEQEALVQNGSTLDFRAKEYVTKPIKAWVEAITDYSQGGLDCGLPNKAGWMQGNATHLGKLNMLESPWEHGSCEVIFDEYWNPVKILITGSQGHWTGANGDRLEWEGSYESFFDGTFTGDLDIIGGTGKFTGAFGNVKGGGYVDPETGYAVSTAEGWITIPK